MRLRVVDASALVELLLATRKGDRVDAALGGELCAAPELVHVEVISTLARLVRVSHIGDEDADGAVTAFARMPVTLVSHAQLTQHAWGLRNRVRVTDAFYIACAKKLDCPLITCDGRLTRAPLPGVSMVHVN